MKVPLKATYILMALLLIVFIWEQYVYIQNKELLKKYADEYGFSQKNVFELRLWTFFTSAFLHGNVVHLVLNLIALFFFGTAVEEALGWRKMLMIFFVSAFLGNLAVFASSFLGIMPQDVATIGASGGIFGLLGAAMILKPLEFVFYPFLIPVPLILVALLYTFYNLISFVFILSGAEGTSIAYSAHIGGLLAGLYFGFRYEQSRKGLLIVLAIILIMIFVPSIWSFLQYLEITNYLKIFLP